MKIFKYFIVLTILFFSNTNAQVLFNAAKVNENVQKIYPMDGSHILEAKNAEVYEYFRNNPEALTRQKLNKTQNWGFTVGTAKNFYAYDFTASSRYSTAFTCRAVGNNCYIFVEDSLWGLAQQKRCGGSTRDRASVRLCRDQTLQTDQSTAQRDVRDPLAGRKREYGHALAAP